MNSPQLRGSMLTHNIARILKHLCAMGVIYETGPNEYRRTGIASSLSLEQYSDAYPCMYVSISLPLFSLPIELASNHNPTLGRHASPKESSPSPPN